MMTERSVGSIFDGFEGYRTPSDSDLAHVLRDGIVALDTNVLLDLYRYGDAARAEFLGVLDTISTSLFVPAQVLIEFWRNRDGILEEIVSSGGKQPLSAPRATIRSIVNEWGKRTQAFDQATSLLNEVDSVLDGIEEGMRQAAGRLDGMVALTDTATDPVLVSLEALLDGRVGVQLADEVRAELIERGKERLAAEQPPGYLDAAKHGVTEAGTGDYLIWEELVARAEATSLDVLLVTRDEKSDWWRKDRANRFLGPRVELVSEMHRRSGVRYFMLRPSDFLRAATQLLNVSVSERTIDDASRLGGIGLDEGWDHRTLELLLGKLDTYGAWVQSTVISEAAAQPDGFLPRARVYEIAGYDESRQLKGFTRPVKGVVDELIVAGEVSEDVEFPLIAVYAGPGKAEGFQVASSIIESIASGSLDGERLTWVQAAVEVMRGSSEWWTVQEIVAAVVRHELRDVSDAKTPERTLRRDLVYRAPGLFEQYGTRFRLAQES